MNQHSKIDDCCHADHLDQLCDSCKTEFNGFLDEMYMREHDQHVQAMDDLLNKLETEGLFYGNQG